MEVKWIKYILVVILVFLGVILPGEMYQSYAASFMGEPNTTFEVPEGSSAEAMKREILDAVEKQNGKMYFVESKLKNLYFQEINIYCDADMKDYIKDKYGIVEGSVRSMLSGKNRVTFLGWDALSEESMRRTPSGYYMLLSLEDARRFQRAFADEDADEIPTVRRKNNRAVYSVMLGVFWAVIIGIILLVNYYEAVKQKKERMIRITMGDSLYAGAVRTILTDVLVYAGIFTVVFLGVRAYEGNIFFGSEVVTAGILLVVLNALVSCSVLIMNYKKAFANIGINEKILTLSYLLKAVTTVALVFSVVGNMIDSAAYFDALSQKSFYKKYENYRQLDFRAIKYSASNAWFGYSGYYYQKNAADKGIVACEWSVMEPDYNIIMANANFQWYLEEHIQEFSQIDKKYKKYMFIPERYRGTETETKIRKSRMYLADQTGNTEDQIIYYKETVKVPVQNSYTAHPYTSLKDPVICYTSQMDFSENLAAGNNVFEQATMPRYFVNISEEDLSALEQELETMNIKVLEKDVYEIYCYELLVMERIFIGNLVVSLLLLLMEGLLIFTVVKTEYIANRKEIVIKKILGYPLLRRFGKLYRATLITGALSICVIVLIIRKLLISYGTAVIVGTVFMLLLETVIITALCLASDKTNIQRILKNGF